MPKHKAPPPPEAPPPESPPETPHAETPHAERDELEALKRRINDELAEFVAARKRVVESWPAQEEAIRARLREVTDRINALP